MNLSVDYEKIFFLYILKNPKYFKTINKDFFKNESINTVFNVSKMFYDKFLESPKSKQQIELLLKNSKWKDEFDFNLLDLIFQADYDKYDQDYIQKTLESWIKFKNLETSLIDLSEYFKTTKASPENIDNIIQKAKDLILDRNSIKFTNSLGSNFFDPEAHKFLKEDKISSGRNYIDRVTDGGYNKKTLIIYCGEPNVGKSLFLGDDAANFVKAGANVGLASLEMSEQKFIKRIGSNLLSIPIIDYEKKSSNKQLLKAKLDLVNPITPPGQLWIKEFETGCTTVPDIEDHFKMIESTQKCKFDVIVIDYLNIISNWRNPTSENMYLNNKKVSEDLRAMAIRNDWVIITAVQLSKNSWNSSEISMSGIAESSGIAHTADIIYAIIQDEIMRGNNDYWLKILKMRDGLGKDSKVRYEIDWTYMRFTETTDIVTNQI